MNIPKLAVILQKAFNFARFSDATHLVDPNGAPIALGGIQAGTSAQWAASTVALLENELGYDTDCKRTKRGDGVSLWAALLWEPQIREFGVVPAGLLNGTNMTYTFSPLGGATINPGEIMLEVNGSKQSICQTPATDAVFTQNGNVFTNNGRELNSADPDFDSISGSF